MNIETIMNNDKLWRVVGLFRGLLLFVIFIGFMGYALSRMDHFDDRLDEHLSAPGHLSMINAISTITAELNAQTRRAEIERSGLEQRIRDLERDAVTQRDLVSRVRRELAVALAARHLQNGGDD